MAHILIIDDERPIRLMLRKLFESEGHQVTDASDGEEGITRYHEDPADLIIMDLVMPGKEGLETIRELKREYPDIKIIAISGGGRHTPGEYLHFAKLLGAKQIFNKPVGKEQLLEAVNALL